MGQYNPGYDIESSLDGKIVRYIEVKSLANDWNELGVGLTEEQFDYARRNGSSSWLYVVERAEQDDFKIHCIPDPANSVTNYRFDNKWKGLAARPEERAAPSGKGLGILGLKRDKAAEGDADESEGAPPDDE
jgi:hypothetical protein